jgi:hypothetical protein
MNEWILINFFPPFFSVGFQLLTKDDLIDASEAGCRRYEEKKQNEKKNER